MAVKRTDDDIERAVVEGYLDDGTRVRFRAIRPEDKQRLSEAFQQLSPQSRYRRFFHEIDHLSEEQLAYLTEVDYENHWAWVAVLPDEEGEPGVGVGRWIRLEDEPDLAEAAVTVTDPWQNRGIGRALLWLTAEAAIGKGIRAFRVWVMSENKPILQLLEDFGAVPGTWESGVLEVTVPLPHDVGELWTSPAPDILKAAARGHLAGRSGAERGLPTHVAPGNEDAPPAASPVLRFRDEPTPLLDPYRFRPSPKFTGREAAAMSGIDLEAAQRLWRALGFPDGGDDTVEFDDNDVAALAALKSLTELGIPMENIISVARVYGQVLSRIADAETRVFRDRLVDPLLRSGLDETEITKRLDEIVPPLLDILERPLEVLHRRHLAMAVQGLVLTDPARGTEHLAVGFVDLVDFSRLSENPESVDLEDLVTRFEDIALQTCVDLGVRFVKLIGDAAMFVSTDPALVLQAALGIVKAIDRDEAFSSARAGLDIGPVLPIGGDYFGRPVNAASRITNVARPGTVVASKVFLDALDRDSIDAVHIGARRLKGVGRLSLYKIRDRRG